MYGNGSGFLSLLGMLAVTALILFLAWRASRWIALRGGISAGPGTALPFRSGNGVPEESRFRILCQLPLGRNERLMIVQAGERCYCIGVTEYQITLLKEWEGGEAEAWTQIRRPADASGFSGFPGFPGGFPDILSELKKRAGKNDPDGNPDQPDQPDKKRDKN